MSIATAETTQGLDIGGLGIDIRQRRQAEFSSAARVPRTRKEMREVLLQIERDREAQLSVGMKQR